MDFDFSVDSLNSFELYDVHYSIDRDAFYMVIPTGDEPRIMREYAILVISDDKNKELTMFNNGELFDKVMVNEILNDLGCTVVCPSKFVEIRDRRRG